MRRQSLLLLWMFVVILPCAAMEVVEEGGDTGRDERGCGGFFDEFFRLIFAVPKSTPYP
ncbi:hypothetical protein ABFS83_06G124800 [Erythranthe nasuta]